MRYIFAVVLGVAGVAVLVSLGVWQLNRLEWKEGRLAEIAARMAADPVDVPLQPDAATQNYLRVTASGRLTGEEVHVLTSLKNVGPGFLVVARVETPEGRTLLVDLGFVPEARKDEPRTGGVAVTGNLLWPNEVDPWFTPDPDLAGNIWFARDLPAMAAALDAEPVLIVASAVSPAGPPMPDPQRVAANVPNDHREYAITWFSLAAVWLGMTLLWLWRIRRRTD